MSERPCERPCDTSVEPQRTNGDRFCDDLTEELLYIDPAAKPVDPDELLKKCHAPSFKGYLHWRCKNSRIKKESSIVTYWKVLSMLYSDKCGTWMDGRVLFDIGNVKYFPKVLFSRQESLTAFAVDSCRSRLRILP